MDMLKLLALDEDDLRVVSAHVQDAVMKVADIDYMPGEKRLVVAMNRFAWEQGEERAGRHNERRRSVLHFERVRSVRSAGIDRDAPETVLALLTIGFAAAEPPGGSIELIFAGGATLRLEVECVEARLADLGAAWDTKSRPMHGA